MRVYRQYLDKHAFFPNLFPENEYDKGIKQIVVIPCYLEERLFETLESLLNANPQKFDIHIFIILNNPVDASAGVMDAHKKLAEEFKSWQKKGPEHKHYFHLTWLKDLPPKKAGVGLARKAGMDEAIKWFLHAENPNGIIISLDADCTVANNYFESIHHFYLNNPQTSAATHYFEHPTKGTEFSPDVYKAIAGYELHMRYYLQALRFTGYPWAYHTVGSCFSVKADVYCKAGGMNSRKAGEEFYFIQKIAPMCKMGEINSTCVYPSPRPSTRVPFGTGPQIAKKIQNPDEKWLSYNPEAFIPLKGFFGQVSGFFQRTKPQLNEFYSTTLPKEIKSYLPPDDFVNSIFEINKNVSSKEMFIKRFFQWFNAFTILKYLNFLHDGHLNKVDIEYGARKLLEYKGVETNEGDLLNIYRLMEKA